MNRRFIYIIMCMLLAIGLMTGCKKSEKPEPAFDVEVIPADTAATNEKTEKPTETEKVTETEPEKTTISETAEPETTEPETTSAEEEATVNASVAEDGTYNTKEEVALYIHLYGHLPSNYITKNEAEKLGWESSKGNLNKVAPGKSIGGDKFGNYEKLLPTAKGRKYTECDIDYTGGKRNAKRIVFSNDGLVYYTEDHYQTFELLYGEE